MEKLRVAAASTRNLVGQSDAGITNMRKWGRLAADQGAGLILFPELNLSGHVRAPGPDYYDRYRQYFGRVETVTSEDADGRYQAYIYEDRTLFPTEAVPGRHSMPGDRHLDIVPIVTRPLVG